MPLLGFTMFRDKILDGSKCQTIRKLRKISILLGDRLYLYWKLRTKQCEKLGETVCTESFFIAIIRHGSAYSTYGDCWEIHRFNSHPSQASQSYKLDEAELLDLAMRDGFVSTKDLVQIIVRMHRIPPNSRTFFQVIRWGWLEKEA